MSIEKMKALSSETRWRILESLKQRRKTVTELAKELGLAPSTVYEHLEILEGAGLVRKIDEGRKWKYYEPIVEKPRQVARYARNLVLVSLIILGLFMTYAGFFTGGPVTKSVQENITMQAKLQTKAMAATPSMPKKERFNWSPVIGWLGVALVITSLGIALKSKITTRGG